MKSRANAEEKLRRLNDAASPTEQVSVALHLLQTEKALDVILAALDVLEQNPALRSRDVLLDRYAYHDSDGVKRDAGGYVRSAMLRALRHVLKPADVPLLEHAASTYEFMPPARAEVGWSIRSNALVALNEVAPELAGYHGVRLLADQYTTQMSGEPAVTAVRILASQNNLLPLYYYLEHGPSQVSEVISEILRTVTAIPGSILRSIVDKYRTTDDGIVLVGLLDLILGHADGHEFSPFVLDFLRTTNLYDVHRYLVTAIVAGRRESLLTSMLDIARVERDQRKVHNLVEALSLASTDQRIKAIIRELKRGAT